MCVFRVYIVHANIDTYMYACVLSLDWVSGCVIKLKCVCECVCTGHIYFYMILYFIYIASFKHRTHRKQTELSNLIWDLKDKNINYKLTWKLITQAQPYKPGKITCNLCLCEKYNILINKNLINRKSELLNKCPHRRKYLTYNIKP